MNILAIETSCDETSIAVLSVSKRGKTPSLKTIAHETFSQAKMHEEFGGVFPNVAKREHAKALTPLLIHVLNKSKLLKKAKKEITIPQKRLHKILDREKDLLPHIEPFLKTYEKPNIDLITVTVGPGLVPALWVGINFAQALKLAWNIPVYGVNHMEGHIVSIFTKGKKTFAIPKIKYPILSLLVSGGHTELVLIREPGKYKVIGETRDDAAGEAFDKVARMLSLPYPGGPEISKLAAQARNEKIEKVFTLPRPMIGTKNFDFSFSGLKTAVLYMLRDRKIKNEKEKMALCKEFEDAVIDVLVSKTIKAIEKYRLKSIIVGGGVSANKHLQSVLNKKARVLGLKTFWPSKDLTGDNALMIGIAGYLRFSQNKKSRPLKANGDLTY